jgi:hypothetical protein
MSATTVAVHSATTYATVCCVPWDICGRLLGLRKFFFANSNSMLAFIDMSTGKADSKKGLSSKTFHALLQIHLLKLLIYKYIYIKRS